MTYVPHRTFDEMPLHTRLKSALKKKGYVHPTEIQDTTLESLLNRRDLIGLAQTGTGKTAAFLIPLIHRMLQQERIKTLVIVPTRELAVQVEQEYKSLTKGMNFYSACFIGGTNVGRDVHTLRRPVHLVVGTPGRLLDLYKRKALQLDQFSVLILDEFDRMLDMGFAPDVQRITHSMTAREQTMLFSATMDKTQQKLIDGLLKDPVMVRVSADNVTGDHIAQDVIRVAPGQDKFTLLLDLLAKEAFDRVLLFAETKGWVKRLHKKLHSAGIRSDLIHGDKTQNSRQRALEDFKRGKIQVLVATDVAARGLDVSDVSHVINFQMPRTYESYIHRIGRTGRAYTFVD